MGPQVLRNEPVVLLRLQVVVAENGDFHQGLVGAEGHDVKKAAFVVLGGPEIHQRGAGGVEGRFSCANEPATEVLIEVGCFNVARPQVQGKG